MNSWFVPLKNKFVCFSEKCVTNVIDLILGRRLLSFIGAAGVDIFINIDIIAIKRIIKR